LKIARTGGTGGKREALHPRVTSGATEPAGIGTVLLSGLEQSGMKEQKSRGWEMAVRVEKVIYMVDNETEGSSS
jgi:hypothetical protein